ncbi:hypothetical protein ElyMa_003506700 [Elysia marginata]|uniref:Uncharacterized protein n=1 Tax=Elysia marginata TaxID=1093978 RepID=A0AAV4EEH6_9GAST|nr:hypothetical protein ElyMa_003506700 [Elysia marginata]
MASLSKLQIPKRHPLSFICPLTCCFQHSQAQPHSVNRSRDKNVFSMNFIVSRRGLKSLREAAAIYAGVTMTEFSRVTCLHGDPDPKSRQTEVTRCYRTRLEPALLL